MPSLQLGRRLLNSDDIIIANKGQKVLIAIHLQGLLEPGLGQRKLALLEGLSTQRLLQLPKLLPKQLVNPLTSDHLARVTHLALVTNPLPKLRAGDLSGGRIFHQVVNGHTPHTTKPGLHVLKTNRNIPTNPSLSDLASNVVREQVTSRHSLHIRPRIRNLVRSWHVLVKDISGQLHQARVSHPRAIMTCLDLTELVIGDLGDGGIIGLWVILDRDLCGHSTHGVNTPAMTGLDQELNVRVHEGHRHGHISPVRQHKLRIVPQSLDGGEDVVPATTVEAGSVLSQLIQELIHLKGRRKGLNQARGADGATRKAKLILGQVEDLIPQPRLQVALHLGKVEVWTNANGEGEPGVVEEVEAKVKEGARDWEAINQEVLLLQVPATRAHQQCGDLVVELVHLAVGSAEVDDAPVGITQVDVASDVVVPSWGVGICGPKREKRKFKRRKTGSGSGKKEKEKEKEKENKEERQVLLFVCFVFFLPSKSAMNAFAPELRALMTIFLSTGPVISTLRSVSPGAGGGPFQSSLCLTCSVSARKLGNSPPSMAD